MKSEVLTKIAREEIDHEPTAGSVLARVIRLERVVEKLSSKSLDEILEDKEPAKTPANAT